MGSTCHLKLALWTVFTVLATAATLETYHNYNNKKTSRLNASSKQQHDAPKHIENYSEELIQEQLARNYAFFGDEGVSKIRSKFIVVVGAGGVGSNCFSALCRSGVSHIRIIDFDQVSLSSLNRHAVATLKDVGTSKVECLKNHILQIAPWCEIEAVNELWTLDHAHRLLFQNGKDGQKPDYVVDCIDNIDTKVDLLQFCHKNQINVISSMGAACKSDATRVNIADISQSDEDPLARTVRRRLKKLGIFKGITCAFSAEKPDPRKAQLLPLAKSEFDKGEVDQLSALQNFRVRILPVLGTMPCIFGLALATHILTEVAGYPIEPIDGKNRYKVYDSLLQTLASQQTRLGGLAQRVPIAVSDVNYILEEVFRGKSPVSGYSTRLTLSRWDPKKELSLQNVIVLTKEEQKVHEQRILIGGENFEDVYPKETLDLIEKRFAEERYYSNFR
ncbi:unnamed protein product [Ambrosiozyma monospora]|uniref:Unnamed protein product n=1 Tax=Ambrosiozyma monospora TaxID=43982 RepID=A0A9W7DE29_AMBMO|nr:unnamed protein product [Ambrosiozyma monospora]